MGKNGVGLRPSAAPRRIGCSSDSRASHWDACRRCCQLRLSRCILRAAEADRTGPLEIPRLGGRGSIYCASWAWARYGTGLERAQRRQFRKRGRGPRPSPPLCDPILHPPPLTAILPTAGRLDACTPSTVSCLRGGRMRPWVFSGISHSCTNISSFLSLTYRSIMAEEVPRTAWRLVGSVNGRRGGPVCVHRRFAGGGPNAEMAGQ